MTLQIRFSFQPTRSKKMALNFISSTPIINYYNICLVCRILPSVIGKTAKSHATGIHAIRSHLRHFLQSVDILLDPKGGNQTVALIVDHSHYNYLTDTNNVFMQISISKEVEIVKNGNTRTSKGR